MTTEPSAVFGRFPVRVQFAVHWGEMDSFAHVNNAVYLRWFESARMAYFEAVGVPQSAGAGGAYPILAKAVVEFRRPVTYPDTITVVATVLRFGTTSFVMAYRASSDKQAGAVVAEGEAVVVMLDPATGRKTPLTESLRQRVVELEAAAAGG